MIQGKIQLGIQVNEKEPFPSLYKLLLFQGTNTLKGIETGDKEGGILASIRGYIESSISTDKNGLLILISTEIDHEKGHYDLFTVADGQKMTVNLS